MDAISFFNLIVNLIYACALDVGFPIVLLKCIYKALEPYKGDGALPITYIGIVENIWKPVTYYNDRYHEEIHQVVEQVTDPITNVISEQIKSVPKWHQNWSWAYLIVFWLLVSYGLWPKFLSKSYSFIMNSSPHVLASSDKYGLNYLCIFLAIIFVVRLTYYTYCAVDKWLSPNDLSMQYI
jgi:hypothetical protein